MVFFRLVQGVRVQKKASCRGNPQHKASLLTMILFLFFLPVISGPDAQRECHFEDQREWEGTAGSLFPLDSWKSFTKHIWLVLLATVFQVFWLAYKQGLSDGVLSKRCQ